MIVNPGELELRAPIEGESLDGFVAAITAMNDLVRVRTISGVAGVEYGHRPQLSTMGWDDLPRLAELLEVDVAELRLRSHPPAKDDAGRAAFFGTTVHRADITTRTRRFSPSALRKSEHHRALWELRVPFDVTTGEILQDRCPNPACWTVQRWRHSVGVAWCDSCVEPLHKHDAPTVDLALLPTLQAAIGLTHPDPVERAASLAMLPARIRSLGEATAFELLLRLIPVADGDCRWKKGNRVWDNDPHALARGMAGAWRLLLRWPDAFREHLAHTMADGTRRFSDGNHGSTSQFLAIRDADYLPAQLVAVVSELHESIDSIGPQAGRVLAETMTGTEVAKALAFSSGLVTAFRREGALKTVVVAQGRRLIPRYDRAEIERVKADLGRRWDLTRVNAMLGVPYYAAEQLCALGRLVRLDHPFFGSAYVEPQIDRASATALQQRLADADTDGGIVDAVPILDAMRMVGGRLKPWDAVIEALLDRSLPCVVVSGSKPLFHRIKVRKADIARILDAPITRGTTNTAFARRLDPSFAFATGMTKQDAGEVLNLSVKQFTRLFADYPTSPHRVVPLDEVLRLAVHFVCNVEIAERLDVPYQQVRGKALALGIPRGSEAGYDRMAAERDLIAALLDTTRTGPDAPARVATKR